MGERMFDTRVLGIDPGVARLGLAVVERIDRGATLLSAGTVKTTSASPEGERLLQLAAATRQFIQTWQPGSVAIERVAFNRNAVSALNVARATGVVMVVAAEAGLGVAEYSPTQVKDAVTGVGNADKQQVRIALERVHRLRGLPDGADAVDAIAVALTHLAGLRLRIASGEAVAAAAGRDAR
jgi:crossover junction endodeoxyribonuclease RuvC